MVRSLLAVVLFLVLGLFLFGYGLTSYQAETQLVDRAVETEGELLETDIEERERTTTTDDGFDDQPGRQTETRYRPTVVYEYEYEGETYTNDRIYSGDTYPSFTSEAGARGYLNERFGDETEVTVYVDPEDPTRSYLFESTGLAPLAFMGIGGLLIGIVLLATVRRTV